MKKIIVAYDGLKYAESSTEYAIELAKKNQGKIFGVFLEDFTYHSYSINDLIQGQDDNPEETAANLSKRDAADREYSITRFTSKCEEEGLLYSVHRDKNIAVRELLHESRFADLMVIRYDETLTHYSEKAPSNFIATILEKSECPVIVVPAIHKRIEKVIFLYDGEPSSTFAIRQFNYVLPGMVDVETELLTIKSRRLDASVPDGFYMREWLKLNFEHVSYKVITGDAEDEIVGYISEQVHNCLVVLGAYSRGSISRMLHKSVADTIITAVNCPLFISHR